jgi:choline dehydrogenase-like flavoprotein
MQTYSLASLTEKTALDCDICIIGSGPAGMTIARALSGTRAHVTIVESGDFVRRDDADALNEIENIGAPRMQDQWAVRNRIVGGASHHWSGRCLPFDAIDFEERDWIAHSGWPIPLDRLTGYLEDAAPMLGISRGYGYCGERFWALAKRRRPVPEFNPALLRAQFWQFSRDPGKSSEPMRFGQHLTETLAANVTLITQATVCRINTNARGNKAVSVALAASGGARAMLRARIIVLCAGAIENPRLLLCSNNVMPGGLGNAHGQVGRYLMDHIRGPVARFAVPGNARLRRQFGHYRVAGGQVLAHGMWLSPELQRAEGLVNCAAWLEGRVTPDDPWNALKRCKKGNAAWGADSAAILTQLDLLAAGMRDYFISRNGLPRKIDQLNLVCMAEQIPDAESRVMLSEMRDAFGTPRARIDWRVHEIERRSMRRMAEIVAAEFRRIGLPAPVAEAWVRENAPLPPDFRDVAHPSGTTRMGNSPAHSVVNADCQVHGITGLYVAGGSVFPTCGHANPTQMIVALALRLADRLKTELAAHLVPVSGVKEPQCQPHLRCDSGAAEVSMVGSAMGGPNDDNTAQKHSVRISLTPDASNRLMEMRRKNLVIVRAGDTSLHPQWLQGDAARSWDLVVNYYGDDPARYIEADVTRIDSKGPKWPALHALLEENPRYLLDYENIWLPDDDLLTTKAEINALFEMFGRHGLQVAQPALTWNSYFGHLTTLQSTALEIRFTNYVEVMAPCFSAPALRKALPWFNANLSGWGLDFIWAKVVDRPERQIAIIDAVTVQHTRPVGGPNYKMLRERGVSPWDELRSFCKANGIDEEPIIRTHRAVRRDGTVVDVMAQPRWFTMRMILGYLPALRHSPDARRMLRRLAGMAWKGLYNVPDRVAEMPMVRKFAFKR